MKRCDYCGKESEATDACHGCGTPFPPPPVPDLDPNDVPLVISKPVLNASRATLIFVFMFLGQMLGGMFGGAIAVAAAALHGADLTDASGIRQLAQGSPWTLGLGAVAGVFAAIAASIRLVRPALKDTSPAGAAWVVGSRKDLRFGFLLGLAVALASCVVNGLLAMLLHPAFGPLTTMGHTRGFQQIAFVVLAIVVAPVPEELLFRGVMYGGYFQSFGPRKAAFITTTLFVLMHLNELIHFLPATLGILGLALAALHMRIRASAIGPAIAVHLGYNSVIAALSIAFSFLQTQ